MFLRVLRSPRGNKSLHRSIYAFAPGARVPSLFSFLRQFQSRYARADGANGFPESICHGFFFHRTGAAGGVGRVTLPRRASCRRFMHSRCRGVRMNVKNDPVRDIPGAGAHRASFPTQVFEEIPRAIIYV